MRKSTRLLTLLVSALCTGAAWAGVPFKTTTLVGGTFADDTPWYTMKIGSAGLVITDNGTAASISLSKTTTDGTDADLWCFVGDDTNGYTIYNKQAGAGKVLASPVTMSGTTGATAYVVLKDTASLGSTYVSTWLFTDSDDLGSDVNGQYMYQKGATANKVNNRDSKLAFWTGGADHGSTLNIEFAQVTYEILANTGTLTSNGSSPWKKTWTSSKTGPQLTLDAGRNNMTTDADTLVAYVGNTVTSQDYTLATSSDYRIDSFSFDFKMHKTTSINVKAGDTTLASTAEYQHIGADSLSESTATFTISGTNNGICMKNFKVTIKPAVVEPEPQVEVFTTSASADVPYRIPAIAQARNGQLIAVADYRYSWGDIGTGRLDLRYALSTDQGKTWTAPKTLVACDNYTDTSNGNLHTGFGDPCIVADRESDRVLVMSCSGNIMFTNATAAHHQGMARFYSEDNGSTWSTPTDISDSIYHMFDESKIGSAKSMFIGSGRIFQSRTVKAGDYYRIYCSVLFKDANGTNKNYVLYSDNFGSTWSVLGGIDVAPIPSGADEPKVEELPDGSILCSSRMYGGRYYNIFTFTDSEKAEGSWGTVATSNASNNGVIAKTNSCNGEVMMVPARRVADGKPVYLALQSVPFGDGRTNVGIYYKELASRADFSSPEKFAAGWTGRHQASRMGSAYSTMVLQSDSTIGFLYEESTYGKDYTIIYKNYSIEEITDSAYTFDPSTSADSITAAGMSDCITGVKACIGTNVGNINADFSSDIETAYETYLAAPSKTAYEAFNKAVAEADRIVLEAGKLYRLRNSNRNNGTLYLVGGTSSMSTAAINKKSKNQLWEFIPKSDGSWVVRCEGVKRTIGKSPATSNAFSMARDSAATYNVVSTIEGLSYLNCTAPTNASYAALHLDGGLQLVAWTYGNSPASLWYIEQTDEIPTGIATIGTESGADSDETFYDLSGRRVDTLQKGLYISNKRRKVYVN